MLAHAGEVDEPVHGSEHGSFLVDVGLEHLVLPLHLLLISLDALDLQNLVHVDEDANHGDGGLVHFGELAEELFGEKHDEEQEADGARVELERGKGGI